MGRANWSPKSLGMKSVEDPTGAAPAEELLDPSDILKLRIIYFVIGVLGVLAFVGWMILSFLAYSATSGAWTFLGVLGTLIGSIISFACIVGILVVTDGIHKVPVDKRAVCVLWGIPRKEVNAGPCFTIPFIEKLALFPRKQQEIKVSVKNVTTSEGEIEKRKFGAASIEIDTNVYYHWDNLTLAVKYGPDPNDAAAIQKHFEEPIADAVKSICANYTWIDIMKDQKLIQGAIADALVNQPEDPFRQAGVTREKIKVTFPEVRIPKDLKDTLTAVEIERRKQEAAAVKAETDANTKKVVGKAENEVKREAGRVEAENRADIYRVAKEAGIEFAMVEGLVAMAQGKSNTILYGLPSRVQAFMDEKMGGKRPEDIIKALQGLAPETLREIINAIKAASPEAFEKLAQDIGKDSKKES